ncbi:MAG: NRDE family protein [Gammaproteobacteria bacterium]
MCLIFVAYRQRADYPLIIAANRDEFYRRPSAAAHHWNEAPTVLAGRDLKARGTWLGITRAGRFAAITNFRDPRRNRDSAPSRGQLVRDYLCGDLSPQAYCQAISSSAAAYNGFNLLLGNRRELWYYASQGDRARALEAGLYGLSNCLLDTPWPKVVRGKELFRRLLTQERLSETALLHMLADRTCPPDELLPDTGVGLPWERTLAPIFIRSDHYGTRSSTVLLVTAEGRVQFSERNFVQGSNEHATQRYEFSLRAAPVGGFSAKEANGSGAADPRGE